MTRVSFEEKFPTKTEAVEVKKSLDNLCDAVVKLKNTEVDAEIYFSTIGMDRGADSDYLYDEQFFETFIKIDIDDGVTLQSNNEYCYEKSISCTVYGLEKEDTDEIDYTETLTYKTFENGTKLKDWLKSKLLKSFFKLESTTELHWSISCK